MPTFTADFWQVRDPDGDHFDLSAVCEACSKKPFGNRTMDRGADLVDYLAHSESNGTESHGVIARIRKRNWPERVNLQTGELKPLGLGKNEAIAEEVSFLYDSKLKVLATQRHRLLRASSIPDLLNHIEGATFTLEPVLREDAWQRFNKMTHIGSIGLKLSPSAHNPDFSEVIPSMSKLLDEAADNMNVVDVGLHLSVGRTRKELIRNTVRKLVSSLRDDKSVRTLAVRGRINDEAAEIVDFIRDRLVFSTEVEYADEQMGADRCRRLLRDAIATHRNYLKTL